MNAESGSAELFVLIKYGGHAMVDEDVRHGVAEVVCALWESGARIVVVHGGGPFIARMLELVNIESEFIDGHRRTTPEAMKYVEIALKGEVGGALVSEDLNRLGLKPVGLSGKDGRMVTATKRRYVADCGGKEKECDLGRVGDVDRIDPALVRGLLEQGFLPVIASVATSNDGVDYNINADLFAGHLAGALNVDRYIVLTNVDGVMADLRDPNSRVGMLPVDGIEAVKASVQGGMIPKLESCRVAIEGGVKAACIINGTRPESILAAARSNEFLGTLIHG